MGGITSSDKELLERFQSGFDLGFEELVERYEHKLYSLCLSLTRSEVEAEAVLSQVFCSALDQLPQVIDDCKPVGSWLVRLTVECAAEREQSKLPDIDVKFSPTHIQILESGRDSVEQDETELFRSAVHNLPFEYRVVYLLHESMNLSLDQVSNVLGISEIEARAFLHRGRLMVCRHIRRFRGMANRPPYEVNPPRASAPHLLN